MACHYQSVSYEAWSTEGTAGKGDVIFENSRGSGFVHLSYIYCTDFSVLLSDKPF